MLKIQRNKIIRQFSCKQHILLYTRPNVLSGLTRVKVENINVNIIICFEIYTNHDGHYSYQVNVNRVKPSGR